LHDLLASGQGGSVSSEAIGLYGGIILSIFLIGWAVGGVVFGVVADRWGRTRTLAVTILIYAIFTGMAALAGSWWELAIYRFLTALGIGGEWAAGAALVAEVWPEEKRAKAAGVLQSAWAAGFLIAAGVTMMLRHHGWRPVFIVGVAPALGAVVVRLWVKEPERWSKVRESGAGAKPRRVAEIRELFHSDLRRGTLVGAGLAFVAVFGLWGATNWTPTLVRSLPELRGKDAAALASLVSFATISLNVGSLGGYLCFGPLADRWGRRSAFAVMCLGSLVMLPITFVTPHSYSQVLLLLPILGFFNNGIFSGFPIYLPELYPTRIRATGAGFCFNAGRVLASTGPALTGLLVGLLGSFGRAASAVALIYFFGLFILRFAPETKGRPLPQ
jgi:MFS family permease